MSKGKNGNKEMKKAKAIKPVVQVAAPVVGLSKPALGTAAKGKKKEGR